MIVRISGEGQFRLDDELHGPLNDLDDATVGVVEQGDVPGFRERFGSLLAFVRQHGTPVETEDLLESDVILPPTDLTLDEARQEFTGEGLVPDPA